MRHPYAQAPRRRRVVSRGYTKLAEFSTETLPQARVVSARGEVDISNVAELTRRVLEALADGASAVLLDLCHVSHLDSSGLAAIISAHQQIAEVPGGRLAVVVDNERMRRTFELRGLDRVLTIASNRQEALEWLGGSGQAAVKPPA
jgi:anti-anti-sigma factor